MGPRAPPARVVCAAGGAAGAAPSSPPSSGPAALRAWAADPVAWAVAADASSWDVAPFKARWKHGGDVQPMASGVAADALFYSALKHGLIHISAGINRVNAKIDGCSAGGSPPGIAARTPLHTAGRNDPHYRHQQDARAQRAIHRLG